MMGMLTRNSRKSQQGLTLVELMIALTVGSILMLGVVQLFSNMRNAYTLNESLSRIQEAGRFSMANMSSRMRMAGYMGCERVPPSLTFHGDTEDDSNNLMYRFNVPIEGYDYTETGRNGAGFDLDSLEPATESDTSKWSPALDAGLAGEVVPGTDVFVVRYMNSEGVTAVQPSAPGTPSSPPTFDAPNNPFEGGDIVIVSDCSGRAAVGEVKNPPPNRVTFGDGQFPQLGNPSTMNRAKSDVFYIGVADDGTPALFLRTLNDSSNPETQELVRGVESMQILYGVDSNGNGRADQYMDAGEVGAGSQWDRVRSARISLLIRGHQDVGGLPDRDEIDVMGVPFTLNAGENRQRRVFTTTVQFRNRN